MTSAKDAHLWFGLLLTPSWISAPITDQIGGREFGDLETGEAASVLEGLGHLQVVRAGVVGASLVAIGVIARDTSVLDRRFGSFLLFLLMLWLPAYALFLSLAWLRLRRVVPQDEPVTHHQGVLALTRAAPVLALLASGLAALLLA